jgi:3-oxoacyl-[acyl-carrier-protein] synthase III
MTLSGIAEVLPGAPVSNGEMAERLGLHEKWLDRMTGNRVRHFCDPDGADGVPRNTGDLATEAGARALAAAGLDAEDLDFLILTTGSPDALMPATVNVVADRLGIDGVPTFQLTSGCAGALQGLYVARALIASGLRRGLVIGADSVVRLWPALDGDQPVRPAELANFALFGDGAGAAVVQDGDGDDTRDGLVVEHAVLETLGRGRTPAQVVRWYGAEGAPFVDAPDGTKVREPMGEEDYRAISQDVPGFAAGVLDKVLASSGWQLDEVDYVLVPQLNGVMSEKIREQLGVAADRSVSCVADTGNSGNALPFIQLSRAMRRIEDDGRDEARVIVTTVESSKWIVAGLGLRLRRGTGA